MFKRLREANIQRQKEWDPESKINSSFRGLELAGEAAEAANIVKKLEREKLGLIGSRSSVDELADELADVIISCDLLAMGYNIDLKQAIINKFNNDSDKNGVKTKL